MLPECRRSRPLVRCALLVFALAIARAAAQTEPVSPAEAVDRVLPDIEIQSQSLSAVLELLGERAGVTFSIDDDTYAMLPWGADTRLAAVSLRGASLRAALQEILRPLGLTFTVGDKSIVISPTGPLKRINRRATWDELKLLQMLQTTDYAPEKLDAIKLQFRITGKINAPRQLKTQLERAGGGSIADVLTTATQALGWTWFPNEDHVVVLSVQAHIAHNLARTITARYNQIGLAHILLDLAAKADVALFLEPGMMLRLPPSTANSYTLLLQQTTVRQALELICAETGLAYEIRRDGLYVSLPQGTGKTDPAGTRSRSDPYVLRILVPGKEPGYSYEFMIRDSELPSDIREYRGQMLDEIIERIRQDMAPQTESNPPGPRGTR
ncbi:MAG: STN domain-containing protein [Phycisphaerae bacterium]|nr:STN domain-containing protein [Phycisphaerae bacterium]